MCPLKPLKVKIGNFCASVELFRCEMGTQDPQSRILHLIWRLSTTYNFVWKCILENIFGNPKSGQILHKKCFLQIFSSKPFCFFPVFLAQVEISAWFSLIRSKTWKLLSKCEGLSKKWFPIILRPLKVFSTDQHMWKTSRKKQLEPLKGRRSKRILCPQIFFEIIVHMDS